MNISIQPLSNSTYYNREALEVIRNLQSLGINPSGNLSHDRQTLQVAEINKLNGTLSANNNQKIQNSSVSFDDVLNSNSSVSTSQKTTDTDNNVQSMAGTEQMSMLNKQYHNIA